MIIGSFAADHVIGDVRALPPGGRRGGRGRRRRLHRDDRHPADRARDRLRLHRAAATQLDVPGAPSALLGHALRREAGPRRPRRRLRRVGHATSGTPACSSPAPTCCWSRWRKTKPELVAGLRAARGGVGHPGARRGRRPGLAGAREDRDRLLGRGAGRGRGAARRHRRATSTGTTSATSPPSPSCSPAAAGATSRSSARTPACCPTRRAASSSADSDRLITLIGVENIVVVDTADALLVTTSEHAQRVKCVVDALKLSGRTDVL